MKYVIVAATPDNKLIVIGNKEGKNMNSKGTAQKIVDRMRLQQPHFRFDVVQIIKSK